MKQIRYTLFVMAVFFALILSAITTSPALADEETPPPPDTIPAEEAPPVDEVVLDETPLSTEETVSELIESLPAETVLVVTDQAGEVIPLASEEAAEAVAFIDPVWCPVGVSPKNGTGGCTISYTNLKDLIDNLMAGTAGVVPNTNGVIWIQAGQDTSSGSMILDGSTVVGNMENFSLTLQGGWNGTFGSTAITGISTISDSLAIINWNGDITIKDIVFSDVPSSTTPNTAALEVQTTKKITLTNVDVDSNTGAGVDGAYLSNNDGAIASDVVITNSTFTDNNGHGLVVYSDGAVTITNLVANSNGNYGAYIDNTSATTAKAVTISGNANQTKFNGLTGLYVLSDGAVTINSLTSNGNGNHGVYIDNTSGIAGVTLTGSNIFRENGSSGIEVYSDGAITINNLSANDNGTSLTYGYGAYLQNDSASTPMPVKLTGNNEFYSNYSGGLAIYSDGAITVNNLIASFNTNGFGADLRNDTNSLVPQNITITGYSNVSNNFSSYGMFIATYGVVSLTKVTADGNGSWGLWVQNHTGTLPKAVTISGANSFSNNSGFGLYITSLGAITLNSIMADNNGGGHGAELKNDYLGAVGGITITALPSGSWNQFNGNAGSGLVAYSKGNITVAITDASYNGSSGAWLQNTAGTGNVMYGAGGKPTWCSGLWDNYYDGLVIFSNGTVTLTSICADSNGDPGDPSPYGTGVYIDNSTASTPKAVTLLGNNNSDNNYDSGFYILTKGVVTLNNISSSYNGEYGTLIDNNTNAAVPQNVTINGYGDFNGNGLGGLNIATYGVVLLNNLTADSNAGNGIYVDNATGATLAKGVTIKGYVNVYNNNGNGLYINSLGAITLANLDAYQNNFGVTLSNVSAPTPMPVMITGGAFTSYSTVGYGMWVLSKGAITINVVDAWVGNNATFGWWLDNNGSGAVGGVTLTPSAANNIDFSSNGDYGLLVQSLGAIKVTNLDAWDNGDEGVILDNAFPGAVSTVTISVPLDGSYNNYSGNGLTGLIVYSNRAITVANIIAGDNGANGAYLSNTNSGPTSPQPITINNTNYFNYNGDNGLEVYSFGVITTNNLNANDNGQNLGSEGWGVILNNCLWNGSSCDATSAKAVMLKGTNNFNGNYRTGLWVDSLGAITASNLTANNNGNATNFSGAYLYNQYDFGFFGITLTGSNAFDGNGYRGLWIETNGAVTINNLSSNWNTNDTGTFIDSYNATKQAVVKLTGNNFFLGNGGTGLVILADAAITLSNIMANWNGVDGAYVDNVFAQPGSWSNATLTITGNNYFNGNWGNGLYFDSNSHVTISNITADNNDRDGTNSNGSGVSGYSDTGTITISCGSMTENNEYGWTLGASTVTLKGVFATGNITANTNLFMGTLVLKRTCP